MPLAPRLIHALLLLRKHLFMTFFTLFEVIAMMGSLSEGEKLNSTLNTLRTGRGL